MTALTLVLLAANFFMFGWLVSWYMFDRVLYQPQRKILNESLTGWGESLALLKQVTEVMGIKKRDDGSVVSPIQIKKEE